MWWQGRTLLAGPQQLVLMPAGIELDISNRPGTLGYHAEVLTLATPLIQRFRANHGTLVAPLLTSAASRDLCVPLDRGIATAWDDLQARLGDASHAAIQNHYAEGLLLALTLAGHAGPLLFDRRDPLSDRVQQLLLFDPAMEWTVALVANRLGVGESTLRRQLAQEGRRFREILEDVRLGCALQLLQTTRTPIGDIAVASGYASASRFAVRFRLRYGLSPRTLRAAL
ncbi:helix-turn-helix transcriptional regulator [Paludibacterium yongneupense]|uniref:helix-turn-helix transcriptional regulator n=1 Tax=Paludibacterium yongneupense TaxID=400061 RepID=UPI0004003648|nr:AraC family transcriptional regulator [Paludibacterium yongneupense]